MYKFPLMINILWHDSYTIGKEIANTIFLDLSRDTRNPLNRKINIPISFINSYDRLNSLELNKYEKNIIIVLVEANLITKAENWSKELREIYNSINNTNTIIIPVAIYYEAKNTDVFGQTNFIRKYEYESNDKFLIQLYTVIYSFLKGYDNLIALKKIKVFISHTRSDNHEVIQEIKKFIHANTYLEVFFDANSIMPSEKFDRIIDMNARSSDSIMLSIIGNEYMNRSWCKRELLAAKSMDIPVLIVNFEDKNENTYFPYISRMQYINIGKKLSYDSSNDSLNEKDIAFIIKKILLVSIEKEYNSLYLSSFCKYYSNYENTKNELLISTVPPEPYIFLKYKRLFCDDVTIIYPDPPLMTYETDELKKVNPKLVLITPLTTGLHNIKSSSKKIMISVANVNDTNNLDTNYYMADFLTEITRYMLIAGLTINYGGNINRSNNNQYNYVNVIHDISKEYIKKYTNNNKPKFINYIASYIANEVSDKKLMKYNEGIEYRFIEEIHNDIKDSKLKKALSLYNMRQTIIDESDALIAIGGKLSDYSGFYPGIIEEIYLALQKKTPIYLIGAFGGATGLVIDAILNKKKIFLKKIIEKVNYNIPEVSKINFCLNKITLKDLNNGLSDEENLRLMTTNNAIECIEMIIRGLVQIEDIHFK
jgi:hypothetical protein